jgi:hypothetical protein
MTPTQPIIQESLLVSPMIAAAIVISMGFIGFVVRRQLRGRNTSSQRG